MTQADASLLPTGFEDLEPFVAEWALPKQLLRARKRWASSMEEITRFYEAMSDRVDTALEYLDKFDIDALPEKEGRLFDLSLALVEAASVVEIYGRPSSPHALPPDRYTPTE